jgi:hypothetical protein
MTNLVVTNLGVTAPRGTVIKADPARQEKESAI